jgi:hypothetical protein
MMFGRSLKSSWFDKTFLEKRALMANVKIQKRVRQNRNSYVVTYTDPVTGKSKYYKTYRRMCEAQNARNELRQLIDTGKLHTIKKTKLQVLTFDEVSDSLREEWQVRLKRSNLREKTVIGYNNNANILEREFGQRLMREISDQEIIAYRDRVAESLSNVSANRQFFVFKQIFKHGLKLIPLLKILLPGFPNSSKKNMNETDSCSKINSRHWSRQASKPGASIICQR